MAYLRTKKPTHYFEMHIEKISGRPPNNKYTLTSKEFPEFIGVASNRDDAIKIPRDFLRKMYGVTYVTNVCISRVYTRKK